MGWSEKYKGVYDYYCDKCQDFMNPADFYEVDEQKLCKDCAFDEIYNDQIGSEFFDSVDDEVILMVLNQTREEASDYEPYDLCYELFDDFYDFWRSKQK